MELEYYIKSVYGKDTFYPVSENFIALVSTYGQKTITPNILHALDILGIKIKRVFEPIK